MTEEECVKMQREQPYGVWEYASVLASEVEKYLKDGWEMCEK